MNSQGKKLRILIAGGGTGGHLFPGISIAEEFLDQKQCDIRFVGTKRGLEYKILPKTSFPLYTIPISGLYRVGFKKKLLTLIKLPFAIFKSFALLLTFRPHLVIGIGGYASGPVLAMAIALRKKTMIQEQNAFPGMTNRILGKYVDLAFVPFDNVKKHFRKAIVVGNPIREAIKKSAPSTHITPPELTVISIIGGSQGAHVINQAIAGILVDLKKSDLNVKIIHQTGKTDFHWLKEQYEKHQFANSDVLEFVDDMVELYKQSHLIISRAGASSINEIIAMGKASILIPIAISSGDHQKENAKVMSEAMASVMIEEKELSPHLLLDTIKKLVGKPESLIDMGNSARSLYSGDAAQKIVSSAREQFNLP